MELNKKLFYLPGVAPPPPAAGCPGCPGCPGAAPGGGLQILVKIV